MRFCCSEHTASDQAIDERLVSIEHEFLDCLLPVIPKPHNEVIFKEVHVGSLVPPVAKVVSPVRLDYFIGTLLPWLQLFRFNLIYVVKLLLSGPKEIRRREDMSHMIVKLQVVVDDRMVDMVGPQEMLQRSRTLLRRCLDVVDFNRPKRDFPLVPAIGRHKSPDYWNPGH